MDRFESITHRHQSSNEIEVPGSTLTVSVGDAFVVWAGEADCPDLLIRVEHAVDEYGWDIRDIVARRIVEALAESVQPKQ